MRQFHPIRDIGLMGVQMVNQVVGTGLSTMSQLNSGIAGTALSLFNAVPPPPAPPTMSMPNPFGGQKMNLAPTGEVEEDFDVME